MKKLFLSRDAQLEIVKQHIRSFEQVKPLNSTSHFAKGVIGGGWEVSQRFMCLIFGKAKFKYMEFEIDRQWKIPGGPDWDYEAILDADDPFIPIKNQKKEIKRALAKARKTLAEIRVIQDR